MTPEEFRLKVQTFDGAVAWASETLRAFRRIQPELFVPGTWEVTEQLESGKLALKHNFRHFAESARTNYSSHRAMALGCAWWLRTGNDLPDWAAIWLADFLEGRVIAPSPPRGAPSMKSLHQVICPLIEGLVKGGWTALRNDETDTKCACDVFAAALKDCGLQPATYEGVKRVFVKWSNEEHGNERALRSRKATS